MQEPIIYVCQARSCVNAGSEAVLLEIEELANSVDANCKVAPSGCLGMCNQPPAALVFENSCWGSNLEEPFMRITSVEASAAVVKAAVGKQPSMEDPELKERLMGARMTRVFKQAIETYRWNTALKALTVQLSGGVKQEFRRRELEVEYMDLISKVEFGPGVAKEGAISVSNYSLWSVTKISVVSKHSAIFHFTSTDLTRGTPHPRGAGRVMNPNTWHTTMLALVGKNEEGPLPWIERDYTPISTAREWETGICNILIKVYPDGKATSWLHRLCQPLLMGSASDELEAKVMDFRAVDKSEAKLGTSISNIVVPEPAVFPSVWFSKPVRTLNIPWLVHEGSSFLPQSVLLLLAGTGVVALPQILAHRDPYNKLRIATRNIHQFPVPIDVVLSCREDDIMMLPELLEWCQEAADYKSKNDLDSSKVIKGVRNCTLLLTPSQLVTTPFSCMGDSKSADLQKLKSLPNFRVEKRRLDRQLLSQALTQMPKPVRVVISGPSSYNSAGRKILVELGLDEDAITILSA